MPNESLKKPGISESGINDDAEKVKRYRKAAEQGDASSQYNLGWSYANGRGVTQDYVEAVKWYRKAAEQNMPEALFSLGCCYESGIGVKQDKPQAKTCHCHLRIDAWEKCEFKGEIKHTDHDSSQYD